MNEKSESNSYIFFQDGALDSDSAPRSKNLPPRQLTGRNSPNNCERLKVNGRDKTSEDYHSSTRQSRVNRQKLESDQFSWDPNSKKRNSRASSKSRHCSSRERSKESNSGSLGYSPKTSPLYANHTTKPCQTHILDSRISPGIDIENQLVLQDRRDGGSKFGSSLTKSTSLELALNGKLLMGLIDVDNN